MIERFTAGHSRCMDGSRRHWVEVTRAPWPVRLVEKMSGVAHKLPLSRWWWCAPPWNREFGCVPVTLWTLRRTERFNITVDEDTANRLREWRRR